MKSPRAFLLEAGIAALILVLLGSFGAVYSWGYGTAGVVLFGLLFLYPEAISQARFLPVFSLVCFLSAGAWILFQTYFVSVNPEVSEKELLLWFMSAAVFLLARCLKREALIRLFMLLLVLGVCVSAYGIFQVETGSERVLWQKKEAHEGFVTGTFMNRNHYAGFMEMVLGIHLGCFVRALYKRRKKQVLLLALLLVPSFAGLAKSGSRAGLIFFISALVLLSFTLIQRAEKKVLLTLFLAVFSGAAGLLAGWGTVSLRFQDASDQFLSLEGRVAAWQNMLPMLKDYAVLGSGLGNFRWVFPMYQEGTLAYGWFHAHQDYLELAVELGLPGFVLLISGTAYLIFKCLSRTESRDFSTFALAWGSLVGLFSISLHGLTDFNFAIPGQALLFFLILGGCHRLLDYQKQSVSESRESRG